MLVPPSIPSWILSTIPLIVNGIFDVIKGKSKDLSKAQGCNDKSSVNELNEVIKIFSDYKEQIYRDTSKIEELMEKELEFYKKELKAVLDEKKEIIQRYDIKPERLEKEIDMLGKDIYGNIEREISRRISLDNRECMRIIKMIPGAKKEEELMIFFNQTIKNAIDKSCNEFQETLKIFFGEVESEILDVVDLIQKRYEKNASDFSSINHENYREKCLGVQTRASHIIAACETVEILVRGEK